MGLRRHGCPVGWVSARAWHRFLMFSLYKTLTYLLVIHIRKQSCKFFCYPHNHRLLWFSVCLLTCWVSVCISNFFGFSNTTVLLCLQDTMKSAKWMIEAMLERGLPVLLYQGMYDVKDGPPGSEQWMRSLNWHDVKAFWESERKVWRMDGLLTGYTRNLNNLTHVVFTGAGHQVALHFISLVCTCTGKHVCKPWAVSFWNVCYHMCANLGS